MYVYIYVCVGPVGEIVLTNGETFAEDFPFFFLQIGLQKYALH